MDMTIWVLLLIFQATIWVDAESKRHGHGSEKELSKVFSGDAWKYLSNLEQSISKRLEQMESRLTWVVDERIQQVNQSTSITHLESLLHHVNEELAINREQVDETDNRVEELKRRTEDQQTEIEDLKKALAELQRIVTRLMTNPDRPQEYTNGKGSSILMAHPTVPTILSTRANLPLDCQEAFDSEEVEPGFYSRVIQPRLAPQSLKSSCYVNQTGGAWTVIQRRKDGSIDFYRAWSDYKKGFGDIEGEFWLGNDHIYQITNQGDYRLRIEMRTWDDEVHWAEYRHFRISDEDDKYRLNVNGYRGNAGNSLSSPWDNDHNGQPFSTHDHDNDERFYDNCAENFRGAWWFRSCFQSHLNGVYYPKGSHSDFFRRNGIQWNTIHPHSSLKEVTMMVRRNSLDYGTFNGIEPDS